MLATRRRKLFYLRVEEVADSWTDVYRLLESIGRVLDSGMGTVKDPCSGWVELDPRSACSIEAIRVALSSMKFPWEVPEIVEIDRGEGKLQSKQLALFAGV